jgi:RNA polymerase sigma factor (sigma-70 family)
MATTFDDDYRIAVLIVKCNMPKHLRRCFDAEDFVSDAIVDLLKQKLEFTGRGPTLLTLVAKRRMIDAARRHKPQYQTDGIEEDQFDYRPSVEQELNAAELEQLILRRASSDRGRTILRLRCRGYTSQEIAQLTGIGLRDVQRFMKRFRERSFSQGGLDVISRNFSWNSGQRQKHLRQAAS